VKNAREKFQGSKLSTDKNRGFPYVEIVTAWKKENRNSAGLFLYWPHHYTLHL